MHLIYINWLILKIRSCFDKWCRVFCVHKGQNCRDENLCKSELPKSNPVVFLLIAKGKLVCNFKSPAGEIFVSCYLFIIFSLRGHSCIRYIRCFWRFGNILYNLKNVKNVTNINDSVTFSKVAGLLY